VAAIVGGGWWSAKRKVSVVLELLRGADLESTSRKHRVTAATLIEREQQPPEPHKRGPKVHFDAELVAAIRELLAEPGFTGEGCRKIWARLRYRDIRTSKDRVL
jgi:hypothetical protein